MKVILPVTLTPEMISACNVPETDEAAWSSLTSYVAGNKCLYSHKLYECVIAHTNAQPDLNVAPALSPEWIDLGYDNRWKMFDQVVGTRTEQADAITITLAPGQIDSIAFLDLDATEVTVVMTDPIDGIVYSRTVELIDLAAISDWWQYFFGLLPNKNTAVLFDLPPYYQASIAVTIALAGGTARCGTLIFGNAMDIGDTEYNAGVGITDYSKKEVDTFGNYIILERAYSKRMACDLILANAMVDSVHAMLAQYRARPVVWVGADRFSTMVIYGFYKSFTIVVAYANTSTCNIDIEGLS